MIANAQANRSNSGKKPNIVFILTGNLGYGEVGVYGGGILRGAPTRALTDSPGCRHQKVLKLGN
jgi:arylsulfatase A-like enzyme